MLMRIRLSFVDIRYAVYVFIILQLPDDGYNRKPKHVGAQKLSFVQQLEIKISV
jgi:hypothetical protein